MTKPIGGEVIEPAPHPDLLAPGTVTRPRWIDETTWARMPWPAKWRIAKQEPARQAAAARRRALKQIVDDQAARHRLALVLDELLDQAVVIPVDPPDVTAARRAALLEANPYRRRRAS